LCRPLLGRRVLGSGRSQQEEANEGSENPVPHTLLYLYYRTLLYPARPRPVPFPRAGAGKGRAVPPIPYESRKRAGTERLPRDGRLEAISGRGAVLRLLTPGSDSCSALPQRERRLKVLG